MDRENAHFAGMRRRIIENDWDGGVEACTRTLRQNALCGGNDFFSKGKNNKREKEESKQETQGKLW